MRDARKLYKTAKVLIGCDEFPANIFASVWWSHDAPDGTSWYVIYETENGPCKPVAYPDHHLSEFAL